MFFNSVSKKNPLREVMIKSEFDFLREKRSVCSNPSIKPMVDRITEIENPKERIDANKKRLEDFPSTMTLNRERKDPIKA